MSVTKLILAAACAGVLSIRAQPGQFDVASIKTAEIVNDYGKGLTQTVVTPTSISLRNYSLRELAQWAWHLRGYQVAGPEWIGSERFDVVAKNASPAPEDGLRQMLQGVLTERFKLTVHTEEKELAVYLLETAKGGAKLQPTKTDGGAETRLVNGSYVYDHVSMADFAGRLSSLRDVDRPVLDRTGIEGVYDVSIRFADSNKDLKLGMRDSDNPSVFRLVTEQLGLRLTPGKAPITMLVIYHAEKLPTGN